MKAMQLFITHTAMGFGSGGDDTPIVTRLLSGHVSPETAYVVEGRNCYVRHWLEYHPQRGLRWVTQTTNQKKPQLGTYSEHGAALFLDGKGHIQCSVPLVHNREGDKVRAAWWAKFGDAVPEVAKHLKDNRGSLVRGITYMESEIVKPNAA